MTESRVRAGVMLRCNASAVQRSAVAVAVQVQ
jgi:hypothetical protein